jgi:hypothetical protein
LSNIHAGYSAQDRALAIVDALGGHRCGDGWVARCPSHPDNTPSLSIDVRDGQVLVYCHAHCTQKAVKDALRKMGVWEDTTAARRFLNRVRRAKGPNRASKRQSAPAPDPSRDPLKSWRNSYAVFRGTWGEVYFGNRGLTLTDAEILPLHTHPTLFHWVTQTKWPAVVALVKKVSGDDLVDYTVHQTFLAHDGSSKAPIVKSRLFPSGVSPVGGGVWFGEIDPEREFIVAEGLESTLSAMRLIGVEAGCAALSELGIRNLILPPSARRICIFADNDEAGQSLSAAREAYRRWRDEGREVRVILPNIVGEDANDVLMRRLGHGRR